MHGDQVSRKEAARRGSSGREGTYGGSKIGPVREGSEEEKNDQESDEEKVDEELINTHLYSRNLPEVDLLIRTSGEKRISNFLLWQLAYSEIYITDVLWPDFNESEFLKAIIDYQSRNRRFGGIESLPNESIEDSYYSS